MEEEKGVNIFTHDSTVSQTASGIMRLLVLMRMDEMIKDHQTFLNAVEGSGEKQRRGIKAKNSIIVLLHYLKPRMDKDDKLVNRKQKYYVPITDALYKDDYKTAIDYIMLYLEEDLKLTKIDTKAEYDPKDVFSSNKIKGMRSIEL
jgi:hypothetical protein